MGKRFVKKIQGETLEERKANAVRVVGRNGVFVVRPDESVEALEIDKGDKPRVTKVSRRPPPRLKASIEMVKGYEIAAGIAEQRAERVAAWSQSEEKEFLKVARYCRMMANGKLVDEPLRSHTSYNIDFVDEVVLSEIQSRNPDPTRWNNDKQMALDAALALLSEKERVVVTMYYGSSMRQEDIAKAIGMARGRVAECVERAKKKWGKLRVSSKVQANPQG